MRWLRAIPVLSALTFLHPLPCLTAELANGAQSHRVKPSVDPFLDPPAGFNTRKPGSILRHRQIKLASTTYGDQGFGAAYQLLYRTTSSIGKPQAAITTVFIPAKKFDPKKHLSYQVAYDASDIDCGPSYTFRTSSHKKFLGNADLLLIKAALAQGWIVSTADYEGPRAAYTSGPQAGYATIDSVRAVLASHHLTGIFSDANAVKTALWGYSGGALASEWALELQPSYAPNLRFVGAALGGLTPNISSVFLTINKGLFAGLAAAGIVGLSQGYPSLSKYLNEQLKNDTKKEFLNVKHQCYFKDIAQFAYADITKYFKNGVGILSDPVPRSVVNTAGIMGRHGVPQAPLFVYKAVKDQISPIDDTNALVRKYCNMGVDITYEKNIVGEHVTEGNLGAPAALRYLRARLDETPTGSGCHISNINTTRKLAERDQRILTKEVYIALGKIIKAEFQGGV